MRATTVHPSRDEAGRALQTLVALAFATSMDLTLTALLIAQMKRELRLTTEQVGLAQGSAFRIVYGLAALSLFVARRDLSEDQGGSSK